MNLAIIISVIILGIFPLILYMMKFPEKYDKKSGNLLICTTSIIGVVACLLAFITSKESFDVLSLIIGGVICYLISNCLIFEKVSLKSFCRFSLTIVLFFSSSIFQYIPIKLFGITSENLTPAISNYLTFFSDLSLFIILFFMYYDVLKDNFLKLKRNFNNIFDESFRIWIFGFMAMMISNALINLLLPEAVAGNENAVQSMIDVSPVIMLLCAGFIAPVVEELTFRQAFKDILKNKWIFILTSGIVFGLLHVVFAYESLVDFVYVIPYASLGIAFAYSVHKTNNIYSSIIMHCLHNSMIIIFSILAGMIVL